MLPPIYLVALRGLTRARHDESSAFDRLRWTGTSQTIEQTSQPAIVASDPVKPSQPLLARFCSPERAQFWYEWRRKWMDASAPRRSSLLSRHIAALLVPRLGTSQAGSDGGWAARSKLTPT